MFHFLGTHSRRRIKEMIDRYEAEIRVWEGLMANQTPQEFVHYGRKEGIE